MIHRSSHDFVDMYQMKIKFGLSIPIEMILIGGILPFIEDDIIYFKGNTVWSTK